MKPSWSKILFVTGDTLLAIYIAMAFVSFDKKGGSKAVCSKVNIEIADDATNGFLDAKVVKERLQGAGLYPVGKAMDAVDVRHIEETLRTSPFVKTAECYKTVGGAVYVTVTQRMPVIRIKASNGDDYYVDDNDCVMPRTNYTSDLIIATGSISRTYATRYLSPFGKAVMQNDLWRNLIEQVNILPGQGVEIVPRIGDHIVYLGRMPEGKDRADREKAIARFVEKKLTRLEKFYKYGLSVVGWNKYSYVNLEFDNQIICKKRDAQPQPVAPTVAPVAENAAAASGEASEGEAPATSGPGATPDGTARTTDGPDTPAQKNTAAKKGDASADGNKPTGSKKTADGKKSAGGNKPTGNDKKTR